MGMNGKALIANHVRLQTGTDRLQNPEHLIEVRKHMLEMDSWPADHSFISFLILTCLAHRLKIAYPEIHGLVISVLKTLIKTARYPPFPNTSI